MRILFWLAAAMVLSELLWFLVFVSCVLLSSVNLALAVSPHRRIGPRRGPHLGRREEAAPSWEAPPRRRASAAGSIVVSDWLFCASTPRPPESSRHYSMISLTTPEP